MTIKSCLILQFFLIGTALAAPVDYNNDTLSDPSSVVAASGSLQWNSMLDGTSTEVLASFGAESDQIGPAHYGATGTQPAVISSEGNWQINGLGTVKFGGHSSLFIAGADFDGDGISDLSYASNACSTKQSKFYARTAPFGAAANYSLPAGKGNYFKVFLDTNQDGKDEICILSPMTLFKKVLNRFRITCTDVTTRKKTTLFYTGKINNQVLPVKVTGQPDLLAVYEKKSASTVFRLLNNRGRTKYHFSIPLAGEVLVGNFRQGAAQQLAVVKDGQAFVYDFLSRTTSELTFPAGTPYDEVNITNFISQDNCFCTSKLISRNKKCSGTGKTGSGEGGGTPDIIYTPDNCANPPLHLSYNDGFKCMASATRGGSIVCLLPYQFTWKPHKSVTDHHHYTYACNANGTAFDQVNIVLASGTKISLKDDGCHNYVATTEGPIGRQHWRNESVKWSSISTQAVTMEMIKGGQTTCLKF